MNFKKSYKMMSVAITLLVIAAVIGVNAIAGILNSKIDLSIDLTKSKILSFSDLTKDTIKNLETDVRIKSLIPEDASDSYGIYEAMDLLLKKYDKESDKITYTRVNTDKEPTIFGKYKDERGNDATENSIIFETDKTYKVVDIANVASTSNDVVLFGGEQLFTSAIETVTGGEQSVIYVTEGHNEAGNAEFVSSLLANQPFLIKSLSLMNDGVPDDASVVMVLSPASDFLDEELDALEKYIDNGGNAIFAGPNELNKNTPKINEFYSQYGISFSNGYVVEGSSKNYFNNLPLCIIPQINKSDITESISGERIATVYSPAIYVEGEKNVKSETILTSSSQSFIKPDKDSVEYEAGDERGPFALGVMVEKTNDDANTAKLLFLSNSYYLHSNFVSNSGFANKDFIVNSVKYLSGSTSLMSIGPKDMTPQTIAIDASQANVLTVLVIIVIPVVILIFGFIVWLRRKYL